MRRQPLSDASAAALAETFRALGDLTRVRMLDALARSELCVQDLAARLHLTESAVSHQLRLLRNMRLVRTRRDGRLVFYALDDQHIVGLFEQGLEHVQERMTAPAAEPRARSGAGAAAYFLFGEAIGKHARSAVGMAQLPFDIPVEIEGEVELAA